MLRWQYRGKMPWRVGWAAVFSWVTLASKRSVDFAILRIAAPVCWWITRCGGWYRDVSFYGRKDRSRNKCVTRPISKNAASIFYQKLLHIKTTNGKDSNYHNSTRLVTKTVLNHLFWEPSKYPKILSATTQLRFKFSGFPIPKHV